MARTLDEIETLSIYICMILGEMNMRIILSGGGSGGQVKETYELFASIIDKSKPVLYIPIAMPKIEFHNCLNWICTELKPYGIERIDQITDIYMLESLDLDDYSSIFIGGGNTFMLLELLKDSKAMDKLNLFMKNDGIIFGGSAGAIIMGYDINICSYEDENFVGLKNTLGFNVLSGYSIFCHFEEDNYSALEFIKGFAGAGNGIIALPEESSIYINGNSAVLIGSKPCTIFKENNIVKIDPHQSLVFLKRESY